MKKKHGISIEITRVFLYIFVITLTLDKLPEVIKLVVKLEMESVSKPAHKFITLSFSFKREKLGKAKNRN